MATNYPASLDSFRNPTASSSLSNPSHASQHADLNDAVEAIQATLGTDPQGNEATVKARLAAVEATGLNGPDVLVLKSADESVASSTTLQTDDELTFAVAANEAWFFEIVLFREGHDFKRGLAVPSGATGGYASGGGSIGGGSSGALMDDLGLARTTAETGSRAEYLTGVIYVGATAGNVTLRWAQSTSSATATTVKKGSMLRAWKVG